MGWRNVWNMRWRAPDQEVDQRGHGERLCRKIAKHVIWTGRMLWIVVDEEADKDWMIRWWVCVCFFWYRLIRVVPNKGPQNGCCCCCCCGSWCSLFMDRSLTYVVCMKWLIFMFEICSPLIQFLPHAVNCGSFCFWRRLRFFVCVWNTSRAAEWICAIFT